MTASLRKSTSTDIFNSSSTGSLTTDLRRTFSDQLFSVQDANPSNVSQATINYNGNIWFIIL